MPTPEKVLGDVSGAPDILPYAEDVYKYFRMLEAASPRVKVVTIGHSEEGREMIAVAIADADTAEERRSNNARLAQLADPRTINFDDAKARALIDQSVPVYYITGTIHSHRNRRAHRADGAGLSPRRRRLRPTSSTSART